MRNGAEFIYGSHPGVMGQLDLGREAREARMHAPAVRKAEEREKTPVEIEFLFPGVSPEKVTVLMGDPTFVEMKRLAGLVSSDPALLTKVIELDAKLEQEGWSRLEICAAYLAKEGMIKLR